MKNKTMYFDKTNNNLIKLPSRFEFYKDVNKLKIKIITRNYIMSAGGCTCRGINNILFGIYLRKKNEN